LRALLEGTQKERHFVLGMIMIFFGSGIIGYKLLSGFGLLEFPFSTIGAIVIIIAGLLYATGFFTQPINQSVKN